MREEERPSLYERYKNDILSDNSNMKCTQCKNCRYWDTGEFWSAYHKGVCQKYRFKPTAIMKGTERCEYKEI